jgi:hypothetical protein
MKYKSLIATIAVLAAAATSAAADGLRIGQVKTASGETEIVRDSARHAAKAGDAVYAKDVVETGEHGSIGIVQARAPHVGAALARRASHRSGRARLTHPAPPVTASLPDDTLSGPLAAGARRNSPTRA